MVRVFPSTSINIPADPTILVPAPTSDTSTPTIANNNSNALEQILNDDDMNCIVSDAHAKELGKDIDLNQCISDLESIYDSVNFPKRLREAMSITIRRIKKNVQSGGN